MSVLVVPVSAIVDVLDEAGVRGEVVAVLAIGVAVLVLAAVVARLQRRVGRLAARLRVLAESVATIGEVAGKHLDWHDAVDRDRQDVVHVAKARLAGLRGLLGREGGCE